MKYFICFENLDSANLSLLRDIQLQLYTGIPCKDGMVIGSTDITELEAETYLWEPGVRSVELETQGPRINALSVEPESYEQTWGVRRVKAPEVHATGNLGADIRVVIIDTGGPVDGNDHTDIVSAGGENFVTPGVPFRDDNKHGTHVHGTIAALLNGAGVAGVGPLIEVWHAKCFNAGGGAAWSTILKGLEYTIAKTEGGTRKVITNNSYGGSAYPGVAVEAAYQALEDAGVLQFASAGNSGRGNGNTVGYPGKFTSTATVASIDETGERSSFSSVGLEVECAAPGGNVYSTLPNNQYGTLSGTSMACPHVVGWAALCYAAGIEDPRSIIPRSTNQGARTPELGYGVLDCVKGVAGGVNPPQPPPPSEDLPPDPWPPSETSGFIGRGINFDASESFDPDNIDAPKKGIVGYAWFLSIFNSWKSPTVHPTMQVQVGGSSGVQDILVGSRVTDNEGATHVTWHTIEMTIPEDNPPNPPPDPPPPPPEENVPPVAKFTWKQTPS